MNARNELNSGQERMIALPLISQGLLIAALMLMFPLMSMAATAGEINRDVDTALQKLYKSTPTAKELATIAKRSGSENLNKPLSGKSATNNAL